MSDAAARALAAGPVPATPEEAAERYFAAELAELDAQRDAADGRARAEADHKARLRGSLDDARHLRHVESAGPVADLAFLHWLRTGSKSLQVGTGELEHKAALVLNATGDVLVPLDLAVEILDVARRGVFRSLSQPRPTNRTKHRAGLLTAASVGWGRLEVGASPTDPNTLPESPSQDVEVHDLLALAQIGTDELDDSPATARAAVVDAIGGAIADAEDLAFAVGSGTTQPAGIVNAANLARIPAAQKLAVSTSNTPTWQQLVSVPFLLPDRYRDRATWVMHGTSAGKIAALAEAANGAFEPGPNGRGLLGWPVRLLSALPDPATSGTTQASILFGDFASAYRIAERSTLTVTRLAQRYAELGLVGFIVKVRVGATLVRPGAVAVYTQ